MNRREFLGVSASAALPQPSGSRFFKKGIWSLGFPRSWSYAECFRQIRNAGFEGFDIRLGDEIKLSSTPDEVKRVADQARKAGVTIVSMYVAEGLNDNPLNHPSAEVRARCGGYREGYRDLHLPRSLPSAAGPRAARFRGEI